MVLAASGPNSAAGASMKSASQSNTKSISSSGPRGPTGPSNSQPRSSPAGNAGGGPGSVSRSSPQSGLGSANSRGGNLGGSTTSRIGSAASAQRASAISSGNTGVRGGPPNAAAAKASAALRSSAALNAGLGRPASPPVSGALNVPRSMGVGGAALGSFMTATEPAVRNYLASPQGQADAAAGWSDLSRMAKARVMARDALNRPGVTYPNSMPAPQGVFGPRQAPRQGYLRDANALGMITTGMPSPPSGMPQRPQGTYSGYGNFNVPKTPQVLNASMGNTTTVTKNNAGTPLAGLPDGTFTPASRYSEAYMTPGPSVPSWQQSSYTGPKPTTAPFTVGGAPYYGPNTPREAMGRIGQDPNFTAERGRQVLDRAAMNIYNRGLETRPQPTVPSNAQSLYTGPQERILGVENVPDLGPVLRDEAYNFPVKPYGAKTQKAIDTVIGATPVVGAINTGLGLLGYSAGDIFTSEENKLANMTPEQRERYRAYWSEKRNQRAGTGNGGDSARQTMMSSRPSTAPPSQPSPSGTSPTSTGWEKDAMAYGYSSTQLQDAETRALIKQLWDMGFIPKTATPP